MTSSLVAGYQLGLGLSIAWQIPIVGVNHMLGHLMMARMASNGKYPSYPFLSILVSGGHTVCVLSRSLLDHEILVDTVDIAAGDALDKCGRELGFHGNMIGKEMDTFLRQHSEEQGKPPLLDICEPMKNQAHRKNVLKYSFASFISQVRRSIDKKYNNVIPSDSKIIARMAYQVEETIFQHIITKIKLAIKVRNLFIDNFVCAGGVGSNLTLRKMLEDQLRPLDIVNFYYPDPKYCTDNSTMIGWAGIELFERGLTTDISTAVVRKWPIDRILDLYGWHRNDYC